MIRLKYFVCSMPLLLFLVSCESIPEREYADAKALRERVVRYTPVKDYDIENFRAAEADFSSADALIKQKKELNTAKESLLSAKEFYQKVIDKGMPAYAADLTVNIEKSHNNARDIKAHVAFPDRYADTELLYSEAKGIIERSDYDTGVGKLENVSSQMEAMYQDTKQKYDESLKAAEHVKQRMRQLEKMADDIKKFQSAEKNKPLPASRPKRPAAGGGMKKFLVFAAAAFFCAAVAAQDLRETESFKTAADSTGETVQLQTDGYYDESLEKSVEANKAIDAAFFEALHLLMRTKTEEARNSAEAQIKALNAAGISGDAAFKAGSEKASAAFGEGNTLFESALNNQSTQEEITAGYEAAIKRFNEAEAAAKEAMTSLNAKKRTEAEKAIKEAEALYAGLVNKKVIVKNDAVDRTVSAAISAAKKALDDELFSDIEPNLKKARDAMAAAEKGFASNRTKIKSLLDEAQKRFDKLKAGKVIAADSAEERDIAKALSEAVKAFNAGDFTKAVQHTSTAQKLMNDAENKFKGVQAEARKAIDEASAKHKKLVASKIITTGGETDRAITKLLADAEKAFKANGFVLAKKLAMEAQNILDEAEKSGGEMSEAEKSVRDLLAKAKARYDALIFSGRIPESGEELIAAAEDLKAAEEALSIKDFDEAESFVQAANEKMDSLEAELNRIKDEAENEDSGASFAVDEDGLPIDQFGRVTVLPRYYVVIKNSPITDCLWIIAEAQYIYGDRNEWRRIYELNKNSFRETNNPHLILPGQVLEIPSLNGEERRGTYNPNKKYVPFSK